MDHQRRGLIVKAREKPGHLVASIGHQDPERGILGISLLYLDIADDQEKAIHLEVEIGELVELNRVITEGVTWYDECKPASAFIAKTISEFAQSVKH